MKLHGIDQRSDGIQIILGSPLSRRTISLSVACALVWVAKAYLARAFEVLIQSRQGCAS